MVILLDVERLVAMKLNADTDHVENIHCGTYPIPIGASPEKYTALERIGKGEERAKTMAFMVSCDNVNMTGSIIVSDSGAIMKKTG